MLFFRLARGADHVPCERCPKRLRCCAGQHRAHGEYSAIKIEIGKAMVISAVRLCLAHIPAGSWVEGHGIINQALVSAERTPPWRKAKP